MNSFDPPRQALAIGIAGLAGFVDALGFLSADGYFVSFMSGNTTRLAVDLASEQPRALVPALLICGFVTGVAGGSVTTAQAGKWRKPVLLALITVLLLLAALLRALELPGGSLGALVIAMGAINNTFQRNGEIAVGLTYMTGALVRLGQGIAAALMGQRQGGWFGYLLLWCGLFTGAAVGALLFMWSSGAVFWLAAMACATITASAWWLVARAL
jgi:uncharacterized membrane protein YoaK (UPF0700 family)